MADEDLYAELSDKDLFDKLELSGLAEKLESSAEWKLLREAAKRIVDRATRQFTETDPTNVGRIAHLQAVISKYKYDLFAEIAILKQEGEFVFEECKHREIIDQG